MYTFYSPLGNLLKQEDGVWCFVVRAPRLMRSKNKFYDEKLCVKPFFDVKEKNENMDSIFLLLNVLLIRSPSTYIDGIKTKYSANWQFDYTVVITKD